MDLDDDLLRELGQEMPFLVDWDAYREQLMTRLERTESARRRRGFLLFAVGAAAGVAATLAVVLLLAPAVESAPSGPTVTKNGAGGKTVEKAVKVAVAEAAPAVRWLVSSKGARGHIEAVVGDTVVEAHAEEVKPFVQRVGNGEIRFEGFSKPGAGKPGFVVAKIGK